MNPGSTYKIIELVGTNPTSWEEAAKSAIETAATTLKDLRIAEITKLDLTINNGKVTGYRARINVSFKILRVEEGGDVLENIRTVILP
jgi:flavin-binding protein dodecin